MPTIRDVAKRAGVSTATVSHVLNQSRPVTPQTRQHVLDAIAQLNYRPSAIARSLTTSVTRAVGVLVADITNPFFAAVVRGIEDRLSARDYNLIVCNTDEAPEKEERYLELLLTRRVDGLIVAPTGVPQSVYEEFRAQQIPLVFIDRYPPESDGPVISADNFAAGYAATEHLIELGHRRIAILARNPALSTVMGRVGGYRRALTDHGLKQDDRLVCLVESTVDSAFRATHALLTSADAPTAIVATNLAMMLGLLRALHELDLKCPDDLSIVCFDDHPWAPFFTPPLTVIQQPVAAMCDAAVRTLMDAIDVHRRQKGAPDGAVPKLPDVVVRADLIRRASCRRIS